MKHLGYAAAMLGIAASGLVFVLLGPHSDAREVHETEHGAVIWLNARE